MAAAGDQRRRTYILGGLAAASLLMIAAYLGRGYIAPHLPGPWVGWWGDELACTRWLEARGCQFERLASGKWWISVPDAIRPAETVPVLQSFADLEEIYFTSSQMLTVYEWDGAAAKRVIDAYRRGLPGVRFSFWDGAF